MTPTPHAYRCPDCGKRRAYYGGAMIRVASWGAGVQSTAMIAMSALGELPPLDLVVHCDLGWERQATVEARDWYTEWLTRRGVEVVILPVGDIREWGSERHIHMPFWTKAGGHLRRECTGMAKVESTRRHIRQRLGYPPSTPPHPQPGAVEQWIGISLDEWQRAAVSRVQYIVNRYPLLEKEFGRWDCANWLADHDLPVPIKSACIGCPFRSAGEWLEMKRDAPDEFAQAVEFDERIRHHELDKVENAELFIYRHIDLDKGHRVPLAEANLERDVLREQGPPMAAQRLMPFMLRAEIFQ